MEHQAWSIPPISIEPVPYYWYTNPFRVRGVEAELVGTPGKGKEFNARYNSLLESLFPNLLPTSLTPLT